LTEDFFIPHGALGMIRRRECRLNMKKGAARLTSTVIDSPVGPLLLVARDGALAGLYMNERAPVRVMAAIDNDGGPGDADAAMFEEAARQLGEYFEGRRQVFDLPLALEGTSFQRVVWKALLGIGYGETVSYGQLADQIGRPSAARAVGLANGRNPVSIIVPCHRVVGSDGSLTGYGGGIDNKRRLLDLEQGQRTVI
jgi:methylated-DNA-[protein]-cysteine S-methyltransferase